MKENCVVTRSDLPLLEAVWSDGYLVDPFYNRLQAVECPDYHPSRYELKLLGKFWGKWIVDTKIDGFFSGMSGSDSRRLIFARERLNRILEIVGLEEIDRIEDEVVVLILQEIGEEALDAWQRNDIEWLIRESDRYFTELHKKKQVKSTEGAEQFSEGDKHRENEQTDGESESHETKQCLVNPFDWRETVECTFYPPSRYELQLLAKFWLNKREESATCDFLNSFWEDPRPNMIRYATQRLDLIADILGVEDFEPMQREVKAKFRQKLGEEAGDAYLRNDKEWSLRRRFPSTASANPNPTSDQLCDAEEHSDQPPTNQREIARSATV